MDRQRLIRNGTALTLVVAGVGLGFGYVNHLVHADPFARFGHAAPTPADIMAKMHDVEIKQYHRDQLIGEAHVGEVDLRNDQETFDLQRVYNGVLYTDHGKIDFNADSASWDANRLQLAVNSGANMANKDFDLYAPSFSIDQRSGMLLVPKEIHGRFFGGKISATRFLYNINSGTGTVGPAMWVGKPNLQDTPVEPKTNSRWTFSSNGGTFSKAGIEYWHNAMATDGDVIVQGETIERNEKTDVITATGNCLYFSAKADMACDKAVVYRKDKRAVLSGNVRMLVKPKDQMEKQLKADTGEIPPFKPVLPEAVADSAPPPGQSQQDKDEDDEVRSGKTTRKYPTVILAEQIEYWYGKGNRHAVITGHPQATQMLAGNRWRKVWSTKADYDGEKDLVRLESAAKKPDVIMKNSLGDDLKAQWFEFSSQEDNQDWNAYNLQGSVTSDNSEDETPTPQPSTTKPPAPTVKPAPATGGTGGQNAKPPANQPAATPSKQPQSPPPKKPS